MGNIPLILFGAGGHARVVLDALMSAGYTPDLIVDDYPSAQEMFGIPIQRNSPGNNTWPAAFEFIVAIGNNIARARLYDMMLSRGGIARSVIHRSAIISCRATIGPGSVAMAGVVVNPGAVVGSNVILNTGCSIDHDCHVEDNAHICPGVRLAGNVRVKELTTLGIGSCVIPGITIGSAANIGAGTVVIRDIPDGALAYGNPARVKSINRLD